MAQNVSDTESFQFLSTIWLLQSLLDPFLDKVDSTFTAV